MKELINSIIKDSQLEVIEYSFYDIDIVFAYFKDKEDFFIFLFSNYSELVDKINNENDKDMEYALNLFVHEFKQDKLSDFSNRNIDNNLSLIIVLESNDEDLSHLHKIEENSIISKKYILLYNNTDLTRLRSEIDQESSIVNILNQLAIKHSNLLQNDDDTWYRLLLRLFIKTPFLNYISANSDDERKELENLENLILKKLDMEQQSILNMIIDEFDPNNTNIESFIFSNLANDEQ